MRRSKFRSHVGICALVFALAGPMPVDAGTVYVVGGFNNEFGTLNLSTGAFQQIGTLTLPSGDELFGMAFSSNGALYGIDSGGIGPSYTTHLFRIDPATAVVTDLGDTGQYFIAAAVNGNTVYALSETGTVSGPPGSLYTVDPSNGNTTMIGPISFEGDGLMSFSPSGQLFAGEYSYPGDNLYTVDPTTAISTFAGDMNHIMNSGFFVGNTLYTLGTNDTYGIYTVDTTNGTATQVGTYTLPNGDPIFASAYLPGTLEVATPEPASLTLLALGGLGLAGYARRRRFGCVHVQ